MSVGKSLPHDSAISHVTGESWFVDDRPAMRDEVQVGVLGSPVAAGRLKKVDATEALKIPGVIAVYTYKDLHHNNWGTIFQDQPILVADQIGYKDEPVCVIAAETREALKRGLKAIKIEVEEDHAILSIEEALQEKSFLYTSRGLKFGDADTAMKNAPHKLSGVLDIGGQEHFYLESQATLAYPLENNQIEIHCSTQHPSETQHVCAEALGLSRHQVVCIVKRMGGGFGGKESQAAPFAAMAGLVAHKLKRSARLALDKDNDMRMTGKRHPFKNFYEVGFDKDGKILALKLKLYSNGGAYCDLSSSVLERAVFHADGAYFVENMQIEAAVCKTNMHSNTAFRGFGGPQGNMTIETALEEIALFLKKDAYDVRFANIYGKSDRNVTPYGQKVTHNVLPELFFELHKSSDYAERLKEIENWNRTNKGKLRGLSMTACKFGIAFNVRFLNQANALVNVHRDGTIQVSTGATEMGQGVNSKIRQIVSGEFGIPADDVQVMTTSTEKNHNTSATAASSATDLNGAAVLVACNKITPRLRWAAHMMRQDRIEDLENFDSPKEAGVSDAELAEYQFIDKQVVHKASGWKVALCDLVNKAYLHRISMGDYGFHRTEGLDYNPETRLGEAYKYFTSGTAVSEVEIDEYTGALKMRRVDLLMDIGNSINPGIDRGQVVGGFIQGAGWMTTESLWYDKTGRLISHSPTTYKIPNVQDTPREFNVNFLPVKDGGSIYHSKAVGEPPLLLCTSVFLAAKHALSFRVKGMPNLRVPATPEEILMELSKHEPI